MNELLQKHGCSNVFSVPEGLKELMSDISREVLRIQPKKIHNFIANYLSALLITREHGIMAVKILEDLCDCRPSVSEHLLEIGFEREQAETLAEIIKTEIELSSEPVEGKEKLKEYLLIKLILAKVKLDEEMTAQVCQVARNAYKDYWYRKNLLKQGMTSQEEEPWEIAARNTLNLYKSTKPSISDLNRASLKIQAAYRGYHIRRNVLIHLLPKKDKKQDRKVDLSGPPLDIAASREAHLGPLINIRSAVPEDNVEEMFDAERTMELGLEYDPHKIITHVESEEGYLKEQRSDLNKSRFGRVKIDFADETPHMDHSAIMAADSQKTAKSQPTMGTSTESMTGEATIYKSGEVSATGAYSAFEPSTRISFAEVPPEIIEGHVEPDSTIDEHLEVPEEIPGDTLGDTSGDSTGLLSGLDTTDADVTDAEEDEQEG